MGRPTQPSAISDAKGYYLKHPERKPVDEPVVTKPLGGPPKHLTDDEKKLWREFAKMVPYGVAKFSDRWAVEKLVRLFAKERRGIIRVAEGGQLLTLFAKFGLTPSDRTKVHADASEGDELDDFLAGYTPPAPTLQ
jgi:phage terminase small subunit